MTAFVLPLLPLFSGSVVPLVRVWFVKTHEKAETSRCGWLTECAVTSTGLSSDARDGTARRFTSAAATAAPQAAPVEAAVSRGTAPVKEVAVAAGDGEVCSELYCTNSGVEAELRFRPACAVPAPAPAAIGVLLWLLLFLMLTAAGLPGLMVVDEVGAFGGLDAGIAFFAVAFGGEYT